MKRLRLLFLFCSIVPLTVVGSDDYPSDSDSSLYNDSSYSYYKPIDDLFADFNAKPLEIQDEMFPSKAATVLAELGVEKDTDLTSFLFKAFRQRILPEEEAKQLLVAFIYDWMISEDGGNTEYDTAYIANIRYHTNQHGL